LHTHTRQTAISISQTSYGTAATTAAVFPSKPQQARTHCMHTPLQFRPNTYVSACTSSAKHSLPGVGGPQLLYTAAVLTTPVHSQTCFAATSSGACILANWCFNTSNSNSAANSSSYSLYILLSRCSSRDITTLAAAPLTNPPIVQIQVLNKRTSRTRTPM
jgi:hypothetical protein